MARRKNPDRLLDLRGLTWWFKRDIPAKCLDAFKDPRTGQRRATYLVNLKTADLRVARGLRDDLERETADMFAAILSGSHVANLALTAREQGVVHREAIAALANDRQDGPDAPFGAFDTAVESAESVLDGLRSEGEKEAFLEGLHGVDAVDAHLEAHLAILKVTPRSQNERKGLVKRFARWAATQSPALTLDRINRKQAGKYVSEALDQLHPKTQGKHLMALRGYWKHLAARGLIDLPSGESRKDGWPWNEQQISSISTRVERGSRNDTERPFTDAEVKTLLSAPFPATMDGGLESQIKDAIHISLLSGMRLAEILTLWVDDIVEGPDGAGLVFDIQQGSVAQISF